MRILFFLLATSLSVAAGDYESGVKRVKFYNWSDPTNQIWIVTYPDLNSFFVPPGVTEAEIEANFYEAPVEWSVSDTPGVLGVTGFTVTADPEKELVLIFSQESGSPYLRYVRDGESWDLWETFSLAFAAAVLAGLLRFMVTLVGKFKPKTTQVLE